jgi:redox-sensitive bicupin YhaK (pirin superfamily)
MGTGSVIRPGDVQRMSAGTGVTHSEYNHSQVEGVHFLQIWILPDRAGHRPSYEQVHVAAREKRGALRLVASPDGAEGSVTLHQDARLYAGLFDGQERAEHVLAPARGAWVHVARGAVEIAGQRLHAGDSAAFEQPGVITVARGEDAEVLLFDLL